MLSFDDYNNLSDNLVASYIKLETELLQRIAELIAVDNGEISGSLEWWIKKLDEVGTLRTTTINELSQMSGLTEKELKKMIEQVVPLVVDAPYYVKAYELGATAVDIRTVGFERVIEHSLDKLSGELRTVQTNAVQGTQQAYIQTISKVHLEVNAGIYSYDDAIRRATRDMVDEGITVATYKRKDGTEVNYGIESIVRRTIMTGITEVANSVAEDVVEKLGADYVAVSQHIGARDTGIGHQNHEEWQGKVYKLEGFDDKHDNFFTHTGYGEVDGLGGINCRHSFYAYFPDISVEHERTIDTEENSRVYKLFQQQRAYERSIRDAKKRLQVYEATEDEVGIKDSKKLIRQRQRRLKQFVDNNSDVLRRDYPREQI